MNVLILDSSEAELQTVFLIKSNAFRVLASLWQRKSF